MMTNFFYYQGDWNIGKKLLSVVAADSLTQADKIFKENTGIDPLKDKSITVALTEIKLNPASSDH